MPRAPKKKPARPRSTGAKSKSKPKAKKVVKAKASVKAAKAKAKAKPAPRKKPARAKTRVSREAVPEIVAEDVSAKQFAYVLTPVEPQAPFALGSIIASRPPNLAPSPFPTRVQAPFAERAAGAGSCAQCDDAIARAAWQVVVTDDGATIHPGCAFAWMQEHLEDHVETEAWMSTLVEHLSENDRAELLAALDRD